MSLLPCSELIQDYKFEAPDSIADWVYLGGVKSTLNHDWLKAHNVKAIVELESFGAAKWSDIKYLEIKIGDLETENILQHIPKCIDFINENRNENSSVLIHCFAGISRSATVAIAWLGHVCGWNYEDCFWDIKKCRRIINPNPGFVKQATQYLTSLKDEWQQHLININSQNLQNTENGQNTNNSENCLIYTKF